MSSNPIRYANGEIRLRTQDLSIRAYGQAWGHTRTYSNRLNGTIEAKQVRNGERWFIKELTQLAQDASGNIAVIGDVNEPIWFNKVGASYVPRFPTTTTLVEDTTAKEFLWTDEQGRVIRFFSFDAANPAPKQGQFKSFTDPYGHSYAATYDTSSSITSLVIGGTPSISFNYAYYDAGENAGKIQYVTLKRDTADVRRTSNEYYVSTDSNGAAGDLKLVKVQEWNGSAWVDMSTTYYRYYTSDVAPGFSHGLKYVFGPEAYARLDAAMQQLVPPKTALTATDAEAEPYADYKFEYNNPTDKRVSLEKVNTQVGSSSSNTSYSVTYTVSANPDGFNNWKMKTVETLPNGNQNIVYTNHAGQVMLKIFKRVSDGAEWFEYYKYDANGRLILRAESSAVASYSEASAGLVTLNASSGLIRVFDYYAATDLPNGAVAGYLQFEKVKQGDTGAETRLREWKYTSRTVGSTTIYPVWKQIDYRSDAAGGSDPVETVFSYTWFANTFQMQERSITWPAVATAQNGSGATTARVERFDEYGFLIWLKDERGFITRFTYDQASGAVTQRIDDVDTNQTTDEPTGWVTPAGGGLHLVTDLTVDNLGRITQELGPTHQVDINGTNTTLRRARWTAFKDSASERREASGYATGIAPNYTYTLIAPITVTKFDENGRMTDVIVSKRDPVVTGALNATEDLATQSRWVRWRKLIYQSNRHGVASERVYFVIPTSGEGTLGTNYNETAFEYDRMGRLNRVKRPGGTITRTVFHARGWRLERWAGLNDTGATESDPTGGGAPGNDMAKVVSFEYDNNTNGKDGLLTKTTQYQDAFTTRVTTFAYDFRNRLTTTDGEVDFYESLQYDNQDRITKVERRNTTGAGNLISRSETKFDNLGQVYQTITYAVDPATGTVGPNNLTDNLWFDASGNLIKQKNAGSSMLIKMVYDGLGRLTKQYVSHDTAESAYADAFNVTGDTVMQQTEFAYDAASNLIQQTTRERFHDATGAGELTSPGGAQPKARVSYLAFWPDPIGRAKATADYGTNGGAAFSRPATVPARSDTVLLTTTEFNPAGEAFKTIDPKGAETRLEFDHAARLTKTMENYVDGIPSGDTDRTTEYAYNSDNNLKTLTAKNGVTGDQITKYVWGTTLGAHGVARSDLLLAVIYPDSDDTDNPLGNGPDAIHDRIEYRYNRLSQISKIKDQNGNIHTYDYDGLGRLLHDRITTLAAGVDNAVLRISFTYEVRGMLDKATSYDNATVGMGSVVNEVQFAYNSFGQLTAEYQAHAGAVNTSTTPKAQYAYADGSANHIRRTAMTYPDGRVLSYDYAAGTDDLLSRVSSIKQGATVFAAYTYLGLQRHVKVSYSSQPGVDLTYLKQTGEPDGEAGDQYAGLDRFGRVNDQRWIKVSTGTALERVQYGYDRVHNRTFRDNLVAASGQDEFYSYDGLNELLTMDRGDLNAGRTGISGTPVKEEDFSYDPTGNWAGYVTKSSGTTDLNQSRSHNKANEITDITETVGPAWTTPAHDRNGNMTATPQPNALTSSYDCTWDAWNRLVKIMSGASPVGVYRYDALNRRVTKLTTGTRHFYYSDQWQIVEERMSTVNENCPDRQFVWGLRYIDDLILRDRETTSSSSAACLPLNERLYVLHDYFHPTALVDTAGTVLERYGYDPYGMSRVMTSTFGSRANSLYDWDTRYGAYRWDSESGFYQVRHRFPQPKLGRWLNRDPLRVPGDLLLAAPNKNALLWETRRKASRAFLQRSSSVLLSISNVESAWPLGTEERNFYAYVLNNPINNNDLWGLVSLPPGWAGPGKPYDPRMNPFCPTPCDQEIAIATVAAALVLVSCPTRLGGDWACIAALLAYRGALGELLNCLKANR